MDAVFADALRHADVYDARHLIDVWERAWTCYRALEASLARHAGGQKWWHWDMEIKQDMSRLQEGIVKLYLILEEHPDVERLP